MDFLEFDEIMDLEDAQMAQQRAQMDLAMGNRRAAAYEMQRAQQDIQDAEFDAFIDMIF
jgi:hypothetical protein